MVDVAASFEPRLSPTGAFLPPAVSVPFTTLMWVSSSTSTPTADQNGSDDDPFATIQQAVDALPATGGTICIVQGDYTAEDVAIVGASKLINFIGYGALSVPWAALTAEQSVALDNCSTTSIDAGDALEMHECFCSGPVTALGFINLNGGLLFGACSVGALTAGTGLKANGYVFTNTIEANNINLQNCELQGNVTINDAAGQLRLCEINSPITIEFVGSAGVLQVDAYTHQRFLTAGASIVNGTLSVISALQRATISVVVPAVAAAELGYADVSTVGTALEGLATDDPVTGNPTEDLAAAGATNGGFINCRVSAADTIRCAFVGALAGGASDFVFVRL